MAISFVGSATAQSGAGVASITVDLSGLGLQENDVVIVGATTQGGGVNRDLSETGGTWTEIGDLFGSDSNDVNLGVYLKRMGASPDTSVSVQVDTGTPQWAAIAAAYRGVDTTTALDVAATTASGNNSGNPNPPSITPVTNGAEIVLMTGSSQELGTATEPSGYGHFVDVPQSNNRCMFASKTLATAAAEDPAIFDLSGSDTSHSWAAVTIALRPAPGAPIEEPINPAVETASALALGFFKGFGVGVGSESDTAVAVVARKTYAALGVASETTVVNSVLSSKVRALGVVSVSDTAIALATSKIKAVGAAAETSTALRILGIVQAIITAADTSSAIAISHNKTVRLGIAVEFSFGVRLGYELPPPLSARTDQIITAYTPKPLPLIQKQFDPVTRYLLDEMKRMQNVINQLTQAAPVVANVEPTEPRKGMVRYAVAPWNPLGTGYTGLVIYDGTAWAAV